MLGEGGMKYWKHCLFWELLHEDIPRLTHAIDYTVLALLISLLTSNKNEGLKAF